MKFCSPLTGCPPGEGVIDQENGDQCGPCPDGQGILPTGLCGDCPLGQGIDSYSKVCVCLNGEGIDPMNNNQCGPCPDGQTPDSITNICTESQNLSVSKYAESMLY